MDDTPEDHTAIQPALRQINAYPLTEFDGKLKVMEEQASALPGAEIQWPK
jgi:hypothetical protein